MQADLLEGRLAACREERVAVCSARWAYRCRNKDRVRDEAIHDPLALTCADAPVVFSPQLCRGDRLVGMVLGAVGTLPEIYIDIEVNYFLLRRLLGVKTTDKKQAKVAKLTKGEV